MKLIGSILIGIGIAIILFAIYTYVNSRDKYVSPIPEKKDGIKVIYVTPQK